MRVIIICIIASLAIGCSNPLVIDPWYIGSWYHTDTEKIMHLELKQDSMFCASHYIDNDSIYGSIYAKGNYSHQTNYRDSLCTEELTDTDYLIKYTQTDDSLCLSINNIIISFHR
jgi:hypothetical protein